MAAEVLRKILTRNVQSKTLASAVSSTLCPNVREFSSVSGFTGVFEAQSRRWRAPPLQSVLDFSNTTNLPRPSQISRALLLTHTPQRSLHLSLSQHSSSAEPKGEKAGEKKQGQDSIVYSEEEAGDLSDKVAPVSRPEAAGWSLVIVAAYGITAFLVYTVYTSIIVEGPEDKVFNQALEAVRKDFRVTSLLGTSIKGYGGAGGGRRGRQRIAHDTYTDSSNVKHTQVQFLVAGNGKRGVVSADMYMRDGEWNYSYLFVDIEGDRFVLKPVGSSFAPN